MGNLCGGSSQSSSSSKNQRALRLRDEKKPAQQAKVVLLGNIAVGKTAITQRFKQGIFDPAHQATLGAAYIEKNITLQDNSVLSLHIWDTAGDERYRSILSMFYRDSQAAILVYDVTDADSFNSLQLWINELEDKAKTEGMIIALVGNKIDSPYEMVKVSTQKAEQFAREKNFLFTECSAKTGEGIDRIFNMIVEELGENQSPIYIKQDYQCKNDVDFPVYLNFDQRDIKISITPADYHKKYSVSDGGISITALDTNNLIQTFNLTSIEIYTPGRHRRLYKDMYENVYQSVIPDVELVFYMKAQSTSGQQESSQNQQPITQAAISFLFNRQGKQNMSWYLEGSFLLSPFANNQQTITINPAKDFKKYFNLKYNHGYFQYHGSQIAVNCAQENVNWFVFDEIFLLSDEVYQYFYKSYGQQNILLGALRDIQQFNKNPIIKVGCFAQQYEKIYVNSNYGFWGYLVVLTIYLVITFIRPNHKNIYQNEYRNNPKTQIPFYSIFKVEHKVYFNKNCRTTLLFTQITFQMFIQSILIQNNSSYVFSFIVFSFVSVLVSWPPCFLLGYLNYLNYQKFKIILDSQVKIIKASEHNKDDEEFIQQIEKSQFQSHKYTYLFYTLCMGLIISFWIISSILMQNWSDSNYIKWAISVPIMIIIDLLFDILIVKLKIKPSFFALKGYYLDIQLADLIKQDQDIKII